MTTLLTRDQFRSAVFERDSHKCVICGGPGQDAHHIIERRLWGDGGYYVDNGATVCGDCHFKAEQTTITCEQLRAAAGCKYIKPHWFDDDEKYDKWGNIWLSTGQRSPGPLYYDKSVQRVIVGDFCDRFKFPKIPHLPNSPGVNRSDKVIHRPCLDDVVVTEKMDGENTTIYYDGHVHARSIESKYHQSRTWVKNYAQQFAYLLPYGWRVCGENLYAKHSIKYTNLESWFLAFAIFDDTNTMLDWHEFKEWCALLDIVPVRTIHIGAVGLDSIVEMIDTTTQEGVVIRSPAPIHYSNISDYMYKWVRQDHVQTHAHWMHDRTEVNHLIDV